MTDELETEIRRKFSQHPDVDPVNDHFLVTTTPFDASIDAESDGQAILLQVSVTAPTLDAVVADDSMAQVVREGWLETFERRIENTDGVTRTDPSPAIVALEEDDQLLSVTFHLRTEAIDQAIEDAIALVNFFEGTYVQGIIPGYDYEEPVSGLLERARDRSVSAER